MKIARDFLNATSGNFAVAWALVAIPVAGAVGLALTYSSAILEKNEMQERLDAAVLAGTIPGYSTSDKDRIAIAYATVDSDGLTLGGDPLVDITTGSAETKFTTVGTSVLGVATVKMPNLFAGVIGSKYVTVSVKAKAEKRFSVPVCVLALNPKEPQSIEVYGNATLKAPNCAVMADSQSREAIKQSGSKAEITASIIGVTGKYSGANIRPKPETDVEPMGDPYASLPVPKSGSCMDVAAKLSKGTFELDPGTYCGGLNISPGATVKLRPGIYVMKDGQLSIGANSTLEGKEVMIAFVGYDSYLYSTSGSNITLTSPKTGTYQNIQMMSDRVLDGKWKGEEWITLSSTILTYDGVLYFPEQDFWVKGNTQIIAKSPSFAMIADQFWIQDASDVQVTNENARGLDMAAGASGFRYSARLSQ